MHRRAVSLYPFGPCLASLFHAADANIKECSGPTFISPLVFDVVAISTYLTVSSLFWYTGLLPDLAAVRDRSTGTRHKIFKILSMGWTGAHEQWRHYSRGYLFFAALATPLVISIHSVVSWDFALGVVPPAGIRPSFAPYFVAGAIHSGLAMVMTLDDSAAQNIQLPGNHHHAKCWKMWPRPSFSPA